jgi:hypothetical protein
VEGPKLLGEKRGPASEKELGGQRFGNLSPEKKKQLLIQFEDLAGEGRIVTALLIHAKYEQEVKKSIPLSTVNWIAPTLDSENVERFLKRGSGHYMVEEVLMMRDGARAHSIQSIKIPPNLWFVQLPPFSPRLKLVENFWGPPHFGFGGKGIPPLGSRDFL